MREYEYMWYVEPLDANTNTVIAKELQLPEQNIQRELLCKDGKKRDLWQCSYNSIEKLIRNQNQLHLCFRVFNKRGSFGQIREWTFFRKKGRLKK